MGHGASKATQGGDQSAQKSEQKSKGAKALIDFVETNYDTVAKATTFDEFYHAIFELITKFCSEELDQWQYKIPAKEVLKKAFEDHKKGSVLRKEEFQNIIKDVVKVHSFTFGKATMDVLLFLFGAPLCAVLAKRVVPGLKSLPDDIVIPVATSGSVVFLAKTNKL